MEQKNLILVGGGGHCKSVIEVAESAGYTILGIVDRPEELGKLVLDYKVIGVDDDIPQYVEKAEFVITVGFIKNPALRIKLYNGKRSWRQVGYYRCINRPRFQVRNSWRRYSSHASGFCECWCTDWK